MITVNVLNSTLTEQEKQAYIKRAHALYPGVPIDSINIAFEGDYADITYNFAAVKFERIRRITGYLVGTLDRFNNAKKAEERDRVKHGLDYETTEESDEQLYGGYEEDRKTMIGSNE